MLLHVFTLYAVVERIGLFAFCRMAGRGVENGSDGQKRMRHNVGLCRMGGGGRGGGLNSPGGVGLLGVRLRVSRIFTKMAEKACRYLGRLEKI